MARDRDRGAFRERLTGFRTGQALPPITRCSTILFVIGKPENTV
jgi:hypothetical protein